MSWSFQVQVPEDGHLEKAIKAAAKEWEQAQTSSGVAVTDETREQVKAACKVARQLVESGAVGKGAVSLSLSGHANAGHTPEPGWAADMVSVAVARTA